MIANPNRPGDDLRLRIVAQRPLLEKVDDGEIPIEDFKSKTREFLEAEFAAL